MTATANVKLYELAGMRNVLDEWLDETGGELTPEIEQLMNELDGRVEEKIERVALFIQEQLAGADAVEAEAKRLGLRVSLQRKAAGSLKEYLRRQMEALGKKKVEGLLATVSLQASPPAVKGEISPEDLDQLRYIAPEFVRVTEKVDVDRKALLEAHKAGQELPPQFRVEQGTSVRIK